jgi:hypothetical protein
MFPDPAEHDGGPRSTAGPSLDDLPEASNASASAAAYQEKLRQQKKLHRDNDKAKPPPSIIQRRRPNDQKDPQPMTH